MSREIWPDIPHFPAAALGNRKETLLAALTVCLPYIGFPRTLNALACINEVLPEKA